jgi:peptide deformylase
MIDTSGAGLAAPQIGVSLRVFTYYVHDALGHLVNPCLELSEERQEDEEEGCLSLPGVYCRTPRAMRVVATGFSVHGEPVTWRAASCWPGRSNTRPPTRRVLFIDRLDRETRNCVEGDPGAEWAGDPIPQVKVSPHPTFGLGL